MEIMDLTLVHTAICNCTTTTMLYIILLGLSSLYLIWMWFKRDDTEPPVLYNKLPIIGHGLRFLGDSVASIWPLSRLMESDDAAEDGSCLPRRYLFSLALQTPVPFGEQKRRQCIPLLRAMYNAIKELSKESLEREGVVSMFLGPVTVYVVTDPEDSLSVFTHCLQKHYMYDFGRPLLGNGLLSADVATWKAHRKLLNPAFSQQVLCGFVDVFNSQAHRLVDQFSSHIGQEFDHEKHLRINNLETICTAVTGVDASEYANLQKQYLPHFDNALHIFNERFAKIWLHKDFVYNWSSLKKQETEEMKYINVLTDTIIQKKKSEFDSMQAENKPGKMKPLIDLLLSLGKDVASFTDEQIRSETNTIIAGGHDTTASALAFAFTLLGSNPQVQEKAYNEIVEVIGNTERDVDKDDLMKLVYIEAILKETLRLFPSVPIIARQLDKDIKIRNYTLKANTACFLSIYGLNRHIIWGPDANEFRPDRWLDKETLPDAKYYASFGLGRRTCIGKTYSMMGMKIMLVHVIKKYRISSDASKMVVRMDTMIRPASGHHITVQQRNMY